jgi:aminoglycoside adenylyltransferase-like protein
MVSDPVSVFGREVADRLATVLGNRLVGAYFVGSVALGGYVAGESDIDIVAVCSGPLAREAKCPVVEAVERAITSCPARGLEFTLYRSTVARSASDGAEFEVNVNGGPRMERAVHLNPKDEPGFWYLIDRGIVHRFGVTIVGPSPSDLFVPIERPALIEAMVESMRWHRNHEKATLYSVLNAARSWRFAVEGELGSKLVGAAWARERWHRPWVIDAAVDLRHGRAADLDAPEVEELLDHVERVLESASSGNR